MAPHPNAELVTGFYQAFQRRDADAMAACYAPHATFRDPVFDLTGAQVPAMWRMLCERGADLRIEFRGVRADGDSGAAHWEAWYTFSATGRKVHNVIEARFTFAGGRIAAHLDHFDFHRWASQALGLPGTLLGWAPPFRRAVRRKTAAALASWMAKHGG
jgi:ketosteroid isomerase-like protein